MNICNKIKYLYNYLRLKGKILTIYYYYIFYMVCLSHYLTKKNGKKIMDILRKCCLSDTLEAYF
jgi:hypothetical protein